MSAQSHHLSDSRGIRDVAVVINLSRWMTGGGWRFNECLHPLLVIADYAPMCAPLFLMKEACVNMFVCAHVRVRLTHYIQLSHTVFDAAAVSGHARVSAGVICSDICNHQGAIGHLLEPGRKKGRDGLRWTSGGPEFTTNTSEEGGQKDGPHIILFTCVLWLLMYWRWFRVHYTGTKVLMWEHFCILILNF